MALILSGQLYTLQRFKPAHYRLTRHDGTAPVDAVDFHDEQAEMLAEDLAVAQARPGAHADAVMAELWGQH